jgi:hypothetical protein
LSGETTRKSGFDVFLEVSDFGFGKSNVCCSSGYSEGGEFGRAGEGCCSGEENGGWFVRDVGRERE